MPSQFLNYTERGAWRAPDDLFNALDREFEFREAGSSGPTDYGAYYLEPPPGKAADYLEAAYAKAHQDGATCVTFLRCDTDSKWWHSFALKASEIIFIRGRVPLVDESGKRGPSPVAASVIIVYRAGVMPHSPLFRSMKKVRGGDYSLVRQPDCR